MCYNNYMDTESQTENLKDKEIKTTEDVEVEYLIQNINETFRNKNLQQH